MAAEETRALTLDANDALSAWRDAFLIPPHGAGEQAYFCGNSLGLQPRAVRAALDAELDSWARRAVEGHFEGPQPWLDVQDDLQQMLAPLVGAAPADVVVMNTLSVNLQLLLASFYRPQGARNAILVEHGAFPSDRHVLVSHLAWHGLDESALIEVDPNAHGVFSNDVFADAFAQHGARIALALLPGVQYRNGQVFDIAGLTDLAHRHGAIAGFDLAHAVGNIPLALHDCGVDFAAWCSYKYLNAGPGAPGGVFVHPRHAQRPRLAGWWGHAQATRFQMAAEF
ncbi:MAG: kynureninase, partial [Pseudomonadota bacterium]|nr:kynureninase [Pseudomonadota bacterium]